MFKVIHFFKFKPGADPKEVLSAFRPMADFLASKGCLERKTWKLYDAKSGLGGEAIDSPPYIQEALWQDKETAEAAFD